MKMCVAAGLMALLTPLNAFAQTACASDDEARGFTLRHLQSRLMVAALSCNQRDAYNTFVQHFMTELTIGGKALTAYFERTGGGAVTDIANGAGLSKASDSNGYCAAAWRVFWELEQAPERLVDIAMRNMVPSVSVPHACSEATMMTPSAFHPLGLSTVIKTAAPQDDEAAVK